MGAPPNDHVALSPVDFLFPQLCLLCGESLLLNRAPAPWKRIPVCASCIDTLKPLRGRRCRRCSLPLVSEFELCMRCRTKEFPFASHFAIYRYEGPVRQLISEYKFHNQLRLARFFSDRLAETLRQWFPGMVVVPVPSRPKTNRKRGWDHVGLMVDQMQRNHGVEVVRLLRRDNGRSQKTLDFAHRLTNLEGRIHWRPKLARGRAVPGTVMLLDDVFTTGATVSECSHILLGGGVKAVRVLTLAID